MSAPTDPNPLAKFFIKAPQVTKHGNEFDTPTGPTTTGDGVHPPVNPELQRVEAHNLPTNVAPVRQRSNTWTDLNQSADGGRGRHIDPWLDRRETLPPPSPQWEAAAASMITSMTQVDAMIDRWRERLFRKPWSTLQGGGIGTGVTAGTTGIATVHSGRCLLAGVHNPTSSSVTFGVSDVGTGDPIPKFSMTLAAGATQTIGHDGLLFERGITLISMTAGGVLTFYGVSLD